MKTGEYLRPSDMKYCIENTNFTEEQIIDWFKRFKKDCPDGKLTKDSLRQMFKLAFPQGAKSYRHPALITRFNGTNLQGMARNLAITS